MSLLNPMTYARGAASAGKALAGRSHYSLGEIDLPARPARHFDLRILADVEELARLVAAEEILVAGFRELADELLPALRASDREQRNNQSERST